MFCYVCVDFFNIYSYAGEYEFYSCFFFPFQKEMSEFLVAFHVPEGRFYCGGPLLFHFFPFFCFEPGPHGGYVVLTGVPGYGAVQCFGALFFQGAVRTVRTCVNFEIRFFFSVLDVGKKEFFFCWTGVFCLVFLFHPEKVI